MAELNFKRVYTDTPNISILTKTATPVLKKFLGETVTSVSLTVYPKIPTVASINTEHEFTSSRYEIYVLTAEVFFCAATRNLAWSKKLHKWVPPNTVLLPQLLINEVTLESQASTAELLKAFSTKIMEHQMKTLEDIEIEDDNSGSDN